MQKKDCWICKLKAKLQKVDYKFSINCDRCGQYSIDKFDYDDFPLGTNPRVITNASGWILEHQEILINKEVIKVLQNLTTPSVNEKMKKLLELLDTKTEHLGQTIVLDSFEPKLKAVCWSSEPKEVSYLINYLIERKFINEVSSNGNSYTVKIAPDGFEYLDEIKKSVNSNIGFCAMPFSKEFDDIWSNAISLAISLAGYDPVRVDSVAYNTGIMDQIKAKIRESKFVVADLSEHKNGVYYEAGFADGLGRQVILTCREDDFNDIHFDVKHINIIKWSKDKIEEFKNTLHWRIEGSLGRGGK